MNVRERVFVGLSGGVDSSVAALRLKRAGKDVVGVFIKVWQPDFIECNWETERLDAMRVAAHLEIPFLTFDAEDAYKREVADYMIEEYREGRTPNPDVMCNEHVKFGAFLEFALAHGADAVATGHYARIEKREDGTSHLLRGVDPLKDQSYFLWRVRKELLSKILFPIGDTPKARVRKEALRAGIPTFAKHDSQGICFLGQVNMRDFLSHYIPEKSGVVVDTEGSPIGTHDGALFYTLGQRHGFTVHTTQGTSGKPYYVVAKDVDMNIITVSHEPPVSPRTEISLERTNWIGDVATGALTAQFRYRQSPFSVSLQVLPEARAILTVHDPRVERPSPGQSCVIYRDNECLGGGIIA